MNALVNALVQEQAEAFDIDAWVEGAIADARGTFERTLLEHLPAAIADDNARAPAKVRRGATRWFGEKLRAWAHAWNIADGDAAAAFPRRMCANTRRARPRIYPKMERRARC